MVAGRSERRDGHERPGPSSLFKPRPPGAGCWPAWPTAPRFAVHIQCQLRSLCWYDYGRGHPRHQPGRTAGRQRHHRCHRHRRAGNRPPDGTIARPGSGHSIQLTMTHVCHPPVPASGALGCWIGEFSPHANARLPPLLSRSGPPWFSSRAPPPIGPSVLRPPVASLLPIGSRIPPPIPTHPDRADPAASHTDQ